MADSNPNILVYSKREDPFSRIPKTILDDPELSWKAKGILAYLLGKPTGWKVRVKDICNKSTDGESSVRAGLNELRDKGYAKLEETRDERRRIVEWTWKIADSPVFREIVKNPNVSPDCGFQ